MKKQISKMLLLFSTIFLFNCQNDDIQETELITQNQQEYKVDQISFKKFKEKAEAFQMLKEFATKNASVMGKGAFIEDYGIFIDTSNIFMVKNDNLHSITFQIINENNNGEIRNLILNSIDGENYKAYIALYLLTPEEEGKILNGEILNDKLPSSITEFNQVSRGGVMGDGADCIDIYTYTQKYCKDAGGRIMKDNGDVGNGCAGGYFEIEHKVYKIAGDCMSSGGLYGPDMPSNPSIPSNPTTGGGTGNPNPQNPINNPGTNNPTPPIVTTPVLLFTIMPFVNGLSEEQRDWWDAAETQLKQDISKFLQKNQNQEGSDYAEELIAFAILNNNSPEALQEIKNILDILDDGLLNGQPVVVGPDLPITNMAEYLSIFNTSQPAIITIYADQPVTNTHWITNESGDVGHTFISIKQGTKVRSFGFYPQNKYASGLPNPLTLDPRDFLPTPSVFKNNQGHSFDVSISKPITSIQLLGTINAIVAVAQSNPSYNLGSMNCTDLGIIIFQGSTNITIPSAESTTPWKGQTPGTFGQVLRTMSLPSGTTRNTTGGNAPLNSPN